MVVRCCCHFYNFMCVVVVVVVLFVCMCAGVVSIPVWVVPGTIQFPRQPGSHVIMVGPGTGCAPFRTYIEERMSQDSRGF